MRNQREAHMFYLARKVKRIWICSCSEKGNFVMINEFKYHQTWKMWLSLLSLSLYSIVKLSEKQPIPTNLLFYEIWQCLNIKMGFQAVKIYFLNFCSCFFTSYLQSIRNKLLKTLSFFTTENGVNTIHRSGMIWPLSVFCAIA